MKPNEIEQTAKKIAGELKRTQREPFTIGDRQYEGDIFYDSINMRVKKYKISNTEHQRQLEIDLFMKVCDKLEKAGFLIHS